MSYYFILHFNTFGPSQFKLVMKKFGVTFLALLMVFLVSGQDIENVDYISPFYDGLAAVKKDNKWGFIDDTGTLVVDFRNDLVVNGQVDKTYPVFNSGRCLFTEKRDGISYFGYIDKNGDVAVPARFLNATDFNDGWAIALELIKRRVGNNDLLEKPLVSYDYFEVIINSGGEVVHYLMDKPIHITLHREYIRRPPKITARVLSNHLIARYNDDKSWTIRKIE